MPYGSHVTRCHACGREYICGDCITFCCDNCGAEGHSSGFESSCPICEGERLTHKASLRAKLIELGYNPDTLEKRAV